MPKLQNTREGGLNGGQKGVKKVEERWGREEGSWYTNTFDYSCHDLELAHKIKNKRGGEGEWSPS